MGKKLTELQGFPSQVNVLRFLPDGKLLATGDEFGIVRLWDVATYKEVATFKGHAAMIRGLIFSPDGQWLYSASMDGLVRRWKIVPEPDPDTIDGDPAFYPAKLGLAADGKTLFVGSRLKTGSPPRMDIRHWDLASRRELARFQLSKATVSSAPVVSPDGSFVVFGNSGDQAVTLWDVVKNREVGKLAMESWARRTAYFSPDSRTVVLINPRRLTIWNTETAKQRSTIEQAGVGAIAFSPDSRILAAATGSKSGDAVVLWNASTLAELAQLSGGALQLYFSPDSRSLAAVVGGDQVTLWSVETRRAKAKIKLTLTEDNAGIWNAAFSPDGTLFAALDQLQLSVWDTVTGELVWTLREPRGGFMGQVAWSPDGRTLVTTSGPTLTLWNVATREEVTTFVLPESIWRLAFAPDGRLATADGMNQIRLWRMEPEAGGR